MMRRKRKSTPVVFGGQVNDEALLMQRQIEEPLDEVDFSYLTGKQKTPSVIQPTGRRNAGTSAAYAPLNHEHPTALIPTSDPQQPVENELRFDGGGFLRRRVGSSWQLVPPFASSTTPQPTGVAGVGTSLDYSRADHSHATALLLQTNNQTPVERELRYNSSDALVMRIGTNWVPVKTDWADVLNKPTVFPITVRKNSGSDVGSRPRLNFIEGSNITITVSDDGSDNEVDITIAATGGGGSINPSNATPQPTGVAAAGTSSDYSRGDHSHATALLSETNSQTPVERELRYNSSDALVMRVGSNWVPVKVDWTNVLNKPSTFPPSTHTHPLSDLTQSGASTNQVPKWSGSAWQPGNIAWSELTGVPSSFPPSSHTHPLSEITQSGATTGQFVKWNGTSWVPSNVDWSDVQNKPTAFPPSAHTHSLSDLTQSGATTGQYVKWNGSNWVPSNIDWSDVQNKPTAFPITVRQNSGSNVGTRPRLNFIEGSNITITVSDDSTDNEVDITISATGGGGGGTPSNATPSPTGVASAGTSTDYSRGDHSHATALIAQSNSQTPVSDELRYNSAGQLVRRIGSNWVVVGSAPVRDTNTYSEQGQNDGEIWYRSNDRALFFRIGGQRVYPAAALFTESESAANTGAGNRMLILSSSSTNILKVGGSVDQNVFAYPKLPLISGQMSSSNANWGSGAGTTPTGALWWNTSTGRPEFYPNAFVSEPFYVERLFGEDSYAVSAFGDTTPGRIRVRRGGMLFASDGTHTTVPTAFYRVWKPSETLILNATGVNHITGSGTENLANAYYEGNYSLLNRDTLEWGDDSSVCGVLIPVGLVQIRGGGSFRFRFWTLLQTTTTTANPPSFNIEIGLRRLASSTSTESFYIATSSHTRTQVGQNLHLVVFSTAPNLSASWSRYVNGASSGTQAPPDDLYLFVLAFRRVRSSETAPRWVFNMRWFACECSLPIMRLPMP